MDTFILASLLLAGIYIIRSRQQRQRMALLGAHLQKYHIEKLMERLHLGYMEALGEADPARREQRWQALSATEATLSEQFNRFATEFAKVEEAQALASKLPLALPFAEKLFPSATFDMRKLLAVHARSISQTAQNSANLNLKRKAFTMSAELFLMQHSCHWFCKSKTTASARMMARNQTSHAQLLASVSPGTRDAYCQLMVD
ncbi:hypothetical protein SAMN05216344_11533 [Polaromonas sp. OV174]|uniref:hypothetical protein n=1 Tax=Polaromonas sp. OV174 TaxID=1855300 RepID=UPI0008E3418A|nr:hypothetical protein [Polaromonas sp. OV174]SFC36353.1 hypothetical protein SAMN05216344_11533 [Polaromonas sp. OV174]